MRIAIPIWEGKISPVLDTASRFLIVEFGEHDEPYRFEAFLEDQDLSLRSLRIRDFRVDLLICGAVSRALCRMLTTTGIEVIPDISGRIDEVLEAYLKGRLHQAKFLMPGCKRTRMRMRKNVSKHRGKCGRKTGMETAVHPDKTF